MSASGDSFAVDPCRELRQREENLFFSPNSIIEATVILGRGVTG